MDKEALPLLRTFWGGMKQVPTTIAGTLPTALAASAVSAGLTAGALGASKAYDAITKGMDFRSMLEANPHLRPLHKADPKGFNLMFSSLRAMNPAFSKDPIVAGTYMSRMMEEPMHAGGVAVEALTHARGPSPMMEAFLKPTVKPVTPLARIGEEETARMQAREPFTAAEQAAQQRFQTGLQRMKERGSARLETFKRRLGREEGPSYLNPNLPMQKARLRRAMAARGIKPGKP